MGKGRSPRTCDRRKEYCDDKEEDIGAAHVDRLEDSDTVWFQVVIVVCRAVEYAVEVESSLQDDATPTQRG